MMIRACARISAFSVLALQAACGQEAGPSPQDGAPAVDGAAPADSGPAGPADAARGDDASAADLSAPPPDATSPDAGPFTLASPAIMAGATIASTFTCAGTNVSPPLVATGAPSTAKSFALVLQDLSNKNIHWVIWDIPTGTASLPQSVAKQAMPAVPAGAKQALSYDGSTYGYLGPCPGGNVHTYEFTMYALDVATLPNVTPTTARAMVATAIRAHGFASAALQGTSNAKHP